MDYQHLDWNQIWRTHHARKMLHERRGPGHWDKRAKDFTRAVARGDYVEQFLDICRRHLFYIIRYLNQLRAPN